MSTDQLWKPTPFTIELKVGKSPGTVIFRLCGPFTARYVRYLDTHYPS
ncbi:MAG TPA: hypothetical protein VNU92_14190 [Edaphobacter sp.]|nr:hypothetical protein [Edaphobacter sp.]